MSCRLEGNQLIVVPDGWYYAENVMSFADENTAATNENAAIAILQTHQKWLYRLIFEIDHRKICCGTKETLFSDTFTCFWGENRPLLAISTTVSKSCCNSKRKPPGIAGRWGLGGEIDPRPYSCFQILSSETLGIGIESHAAYAVQMNAKPF